MAERNVGVNAQPPAKKRSLVRMMLLIFVLVLATFSVVIAMQPSEFRIERSATIEAPPKIVFAQVNDFRKWEAWSPWAKLDPNSQVKFQGPESGKDAKFYWSGNEQVGQGSMTIVESKPYERIDIRLEFIKPMEGTNLTEFTFEPVGDEGKSTRVTWAMSGTNNFIGKAFCLVMNMQKEVGGQFDKGLGKMKEVAEAEAKAKN